MHAATDTRPIGGSNESLQMRSELTLNSKKKTRWRRPAVIPCCLYRKGFISLLLTGKHVLHVILHKCGIVLF